MLDLSNISKTFTVSFLFIFLVFTVSAQQPNPVQTNINTGVGLNIEFTKINILQNSQDHLFNAHVFNVSNQLRVDNTTTECNFHLFNDIGTPLIDQELMIFDSNGLDWDINILGGNFTDNGDYSYLIVCNSTDVGGFVSVPIEVTPDGKGIQIFPFQFALIFLAVFLVAVSFLHKRLTLFKYIGSLMMMNLGVITLYPGYALISWSNLSGKLLGFSLIALGFYFLIEDSFSREEQAKRFDRDHFPENKKEKKLFEGREGDD